MTTDRTTLWEAYNDAASERDDAQAELDACPRWRWLHRNYLAAILAIAEVRVSALRAVYVNQRTS